MRKNFTKSIVFKGAAISLAALLSMPGHLVFAQTQNNYKSQITDYKLPNGVGANNHSPVLVLSSVSYSQPMLKGLRFNPANPLKLEFIIDTADQKKVTKEESTKLIKYFLAGLTLPEDDLWVNLSPYEQNRIIPESLGYTDLGKEMLEQDYLLKQLTASLTYPETEQGKKYWDEINNPNRSLSEPRPSIHPANGRDTQGAARIETTQSFNKIWIMPDQAGIYENNNTGFITEATLKVMMEEDYVAGRFDTSRSLSVPPGAERIETNGTLSDRATQSFKQYILPLISQEVNHGKNFANLRQIYNSLILAVWFKQKFKQSFYKSYIDQRKIKGIDLTDKNIKEKIWQQYVQAFKQGAYDYIKSERVGANNHSPAQKITKRRYFSGGVAFESLKPKVEVMPRPGSPYKALRNILGGLLVVTIAVGVGVIINGKHTTVYAPTRDGAVSDAEDKVLSRHFAMTKFTAIQQTEIDNDKIKNERYRASMTLIALSGGFDTEGWAELTLEQALRRIRHDILLSSIADRFTVYDAAFVLSRLFKAGLASKDDFPPQAFKNIMQLILQEGYNYDDHISSLALKELAQAGLVTPADMPYLPIQDKAWWGEGLGDKDRFITTANLFEAGLVSKDMLPAELISKNIAQCMNLTDEPNYSELQPYRNVMAMVDAGAIPLPEGFFTKGVYDYAITMDKAMEWLRKGILTPNDFTPDLVRQLVANGASGPWQEALRQYGVPEEVILGGQQLAAPRRRRRSKHDKPEEEISRYRRRAMAHLRSGEDKTTGADSSENRLAENAAILGLDVDRVREQTQINKAVRYGMPVVAGHPFTGLMHGQIVQWDEKVADITGGQFHLDINSSHTTLDDIVLVQAEPITARQLASVEMDSIRQSILPGVPAFTMVFTKMFLDASGSGNLILVGKVRGTDIAKIRKRLKMAGTAEWPSFRENDVHITLGHISTEVLRVLTGAQAHALLEWVKSHGEIAPLEVPVAELKILHTCVRSAKKVVSPDEVFPLQQLAASDGGVNLTAKNFKIKTNGDNDATVGARHASSAITGGAGPSPTNGNAQNYDYLTFDITDLKDITKKDAENFVAGVP